MIGSEHLSRTACRGGSGAADDHDRTPVARDGRSGGQRRERQQRRNPAGVQPRAGGDGCSGRRGVDLTVPTGVPNEKGGPPKRPTLSDVKPTGYFDRIAIDGRRERWRLAGFGVRQFRLNRDLRRRQTSSGRGTELTRSCCRLCVVCQEG